MDVSEVLERRAQPKPVEEPRQERLHALLLTHERPGFLSDTLESLAETAPDLPVWVFDDGSTSNNKELELAMSQSEQVRIWRLPKLGFVGAWVRIFGIARESLPDVDAFVLLEDDLRFAHRWLDILQMVRRGVRMDGMLPGAVTCLRPHAMPQGPVMQVEGGVPVYPSMAHTFHVNLVGRDVIEAEHVIEESAREALASKTGKGLDVYLFGNLCHRLKMTNFVTFQSWVAHMGFANSVVLGQGYRAFMGYGDNLVPELEEVVQREWQERNQ